ncbi:hypothetical protein J8273_4866 [Carpediemonas membranifera]|uniref:DUF6891 domain-containing protein n=1 Tax=Carpediemonas membranifera TaxID=201153 RepID=A0A8J6BB90_9EUKA|nr:hypothetical protein J8273_4866 [Carpediemonas membranifera]|eukprot:KAG9393747.1 hypothetical protein J8273_4866 [Carpediemonas membranifera]
MVFELVLYVNGLEAAVSLMVRAGFFTASQIREQFVDVADQPSVGLNKDTIEEDINKIIRETLSKLKEESKSWPEETDNDRLSRAFKNLNAVGIKAVECFGYEKSDGNELYHKIKNKKRFRGYCFYHRQDVITAVRNGGVAIRFDTTKPKTIAEEQAEIGRLVQSALVNVGLETDWNGTAGRVIWVKPFEWCKREALSMAAEEEVE